MSLAPTPIDLLARARADLRMGVPVVLTDADAGVLVAAVETLTAGRLAEIRALGGKPVVVSSARRADTLKARAYDGDVARIVLGDGFGLRRIRATADPQTDLEAPIAALFERYAKQLISG